MDNITNIEKEFIKSLDIHNQSFTNFLFCYTSYLDKILSLNASKFSGTLNINNDTDTKTILDDIPKIDIQIAELKSKIKKETNFSDKVNLNIEVKKRTDNKIIIPQIRQREIYWANLGENIGFEQNGKDDNFMRPLLIFKKFSNNIFFGIPLSTQRKKDGSFFFEFSFKNDEYNVLPCQDHLTKFSYSKYL